MTNIFTNHGHTRKDVPSSTQPSIGQAALGNTRNAVEARLAQKAEDYSKDALNSELHLINSLLVVATSTLAILSALYEPQRNTQCSRLVFLLSLILLLLLVAVLIALACMNIKYRHLQRKLLLGLLQDARNGLDLPVVSSASNYKIEKPLQIAAVTLFALAYISLFAYAVMICFA